MADERLTDEELAALSRDSWSDLTIPRLVADVRASRAELDRCRATMIRALDALESDADADARRDAFELIQERFEGVRTDDHDRAAGLIGHLRAELDAREGGPGGEDAR